MYNNIGGKIKMLARVLAWIGIIACFIRRVSIQKIRNGAMRYI